jgi:hypothetical protein
MRKTIATLSVIGAFALAGVTIAGGLNGDGTDHGWNNESMLASGGDLHNEPVSPAIDWLTPQTHSQRSDYLPYGSEFAGAPPSEDPSGWNSDNSIDVDGLEGVVLPS